MGGGRSWPSTVLIGPTVRGLRAHTFQLEWLVRWVGSMCSYILKNIDRQSFENLIVRVPKQRVLMTGGSTVIVFLFVLLEFGALQCNINVKKRLNTQYLADPCTISLQKKKNYPWSNSSGHLATPSAIHVRRCATRMIFSWHVVHVFSLSN